MGDLFFVIRMGVYTLFVVILLQVKIGPTTLEQKLQYFTHESQAAGMALKVAQGAADFIGVQYNNLTKNVKSRFIEQHSPSQRPGSRLENKIQDLRDSLNKTWKEYEEENKSAKNDETII